MSHYGTYLGGAIRCPGVERTAPPERPQDRPRADGRMRRACLDALRTPGSVRDVASRLGWEPSRAKSWVHWLRRHQLIARVDETRIRGQRAGVFQVAK